MEKVIESMCEWAPVRLRTLCIDVAKALPEMIKEYAETYLVSLMKRFLVSRNG